MIKIFEAGELITLNTISKAEKEMGINIPETYRSFLLINNGGRPEPDNIEIEDLPGIETDVAWFMGITREIKSNTIDFNLSIIREGYPHKHAIPIASDSCGGIFCLDLEDRNGIPVVYFEYGGAWHGAPYEPIHVAPSFDDFLQMIH